MGTAWNFGVMRGVEKMRKEDLMMFKRKIYNKCLSGKGIRWKDSTSY